MPYRASNPPKKTRTLKPKGRRQWTHVYNSARRGGDSEGSAHQQAWSAARKSHQRKAAFALDLGVKVAAQSLRKSGQDPIAAAQQQAMPPLAAGGQDPFAAAQRQALELVRTRGAYQQPPPSLGPDSGMAGPGGAYSPADIMSRGQVTPSGAPAQVGQQPFLQRLQGLDWKNILPWLLMTGGGIGLLRNLFGGGGKQRSALSWLLPALAMGGGGALLARNRGLFGSWSGAGGGAGETGSQAPELVD